MNTPSLDRRLFLKVVGATAAVSASSSLAGAAGASPAIGVNGRSRPRRIAIIGGGCAGVTLARFLEKRGETDITIFERAKAVGGKCKTLTFAGFPDVYEMGAVEATGDYGVIGEMANELGLPVEPMPGDALVDLHHPNPPQLPPEAYLYASLGAAGYAQFQAEYGFWLQFLAQHPEVQSTGFTNLPPELCVTFDEWRRANNLTVLQRAFLIPITLYGYGYILGDDASGNIPLVYVMKFLNAERLATIFKTNGLVSPIAGTVPGGLYRFSKGGFGGLMAAVAGALQHTTIRTNTPVVSVNRRPNDECEDNAPSRVRVGFMQDGRHGEAVFDDVVIAIPQTLANLQAIGLDLTDAERNLFVNVRTRNYFTCAIRTNQFLPQTGGYDFVMDYSTSPPSIAFHPAAGEPFQLFVPMTKATATGDAMAVCYTYSDQPMSLNAVRANMIAGINSLGGTPLTQADILDANAWQYFPHVDTNALASGFYDTLEALQGSNGTYWAGGLMNFELTERTAAYSMQLAQNYFG